MSEAEDVSVDQYDRIWLHHVAIWVTEFVELTRENIIDAGMVASHSERGGDFADHPNIVAYLHNGNVSDAMVPLAPFRWIGEDEDDEEVVTSEPPDVFRLLKAEVAAVFERWGCGDAVDALPREGRYFPGIDEPARVLTPAEVRRLSRAIRQLEWFIFCLPRRDDEPEAVVEEPKTEAEGAGYIQSLLDPIFFRTRRFLDAADLTVIGESLADLRASPGAMEVFRTHNFRNTFRVSQSDRHPEGGRLLNILARAKAFLRSAETCLPIEGDDERSSRPFGWDWRAAEYYVCEAASALCDVMDGEDGQLGESSVSNARGWNTEINFGLRCLDTQIDSLLGQWGVTTWEHRLSQDGVEPTRPVSIGADQLAGLRRTVETIENGFANAGIETPDRSPGVEREKARRREMLGKRGKIIAVYHDHKDWSYAQIAEAAGADRGHVCRVLKPLRDRDKGQFKANLPRGSKDGDGVFDAWDMKG